MVAGIIYTCIGKAGAFAPGAQKFAQQASPTDRCAACSTTASAS